MPFPRGKTKAGLGDSWPPSLAPLGYHVFVYPGELVQPRKESVPPLVTASHHLVQVVQQNFL